MSVYFFREKNVSITTAGTPVTTLLGKTDDKLVRQIKIVNNNATAKLVYGLSATVDAMSTPKIGQVLNPGEYAVEPVNFPGTPIYIDSDTSSTKATVHYYTEQTL